MPGIHTFYDGSNAFESIAEVSGISVDKVNFVLCLFASLGISYIYRVFFPAKQTSRTVRSLVPLIVGLAMCLFCFGGAIKHLFTNVIGSYLMIRIIPAKYVHIVVVLFSMGYLLYIHYFRYVVLNSYLLDITGPIMIAVQKITMIACSIHDGRGRKEESLNAGQKREALKEVPSFLDYMSYMLNFQTVMSGPANVFSDYNAFIEGTHVPENAASPTGVAMKKFIYCMVFLLIVATLGHEYTPELLATPKYMSLPLLPWLCYWFFSIFLIRVGYYFAWTFSDAICNMSGFGYSGVDKNGKEQWRLCTNVDPFQVEMAQSFKETLDGWNIGTMGWLRRVAYERLPKSSNTFGTYLMSALWHGVAPGYYLTFITGGVVTSAGQSFRRCLRWRFVDDASQKMVYDAITFFGTKLILAYTTYAFVTLEWSIAIPVYRRVYFLGHIISLLIFLGLPKILKQQRQKKPEENGSGDTITRNDAKLQKTE